MNRFDKVDDPRRRLLVEALTVGLIAASFPTGNAHAQLFGRRPTQLPPGQSIYRIAGTALVNGKAATLQTLVRPGDTVETGKDSEIVFVVSGHSMIMRPETHLVIESERKDATSLPATGLRMRMQDHRHRCARARRGRETGFETAFGTGNGNCWHVCFRF